MDFQLIAQRAIAVRNKYSELEKKKYGKEWTREQIMEGLVGDVGDLMKLVMSKSGIRNIDNVDEKLAHELCDCLWCVIVLAQKYGIDLEDTFMRKMSELEEKIAGEIK
jgi:NTP pyrophosphatase (non-canonical NTP hydrolase)